MNINLKHFHKNIFPGAFSRVGNGIFQTILGFNITYNIGDGDFYGSIIVKKKNTGIYNLVCSFIDLGGLINKDFCCSYIDKTEKHDKTEIF